MTQVMWNSPHTRGSAPSNLLASCGETGDAHRAATHSPAQLSQPLIDVIELVVLDINVSLAIRSETPLEGHLGTEVLQRLLVTQVRGGRGLNRSLQ